MTIQQSSQPKKSSLLKKLLSRINLQPAITHEQWERLESKKQIKTSEQVRTHMRIH